MPTNKKKITMVKKLARQKRPTLPRELDRRRETGVWHSPRTDKHPS